MMACCLIGCQEKIEIQSIETSEPYTIQNELEFEMIKTEVSEQIAPSNKNKTYKYIKPTDDQHIFIDVVMKTMNLSDKEKKLKDTYSGQYEVNNESYDIEIAVEAVNYNQISTTDTLKPNESRYVHLYCEVLKEQVKENATISFKVLGNQEYTHTFSTKQEIVNNDTKSLGDVLTLQKSQIVLNAMTQTKKIEPSNKGFFYSYIPPENDDETFVVLQVDVKNTTDVAIDPGEYIFCEFYVEEQKVQSEIIIESENHKSLSKSGVIEPLQTRTLYLAMPIKDNLLDKSGTIHMFVEGCTFEVQQ